MGSGSAWPCLALLRWRHLSQAFAKATATLAPWESACRIQVALQGCGLIYSPPPP